VFFIGTSNDISKLPPEMSRAERFDGVFYVDIPSATEKAKIWPIHLKKYGIAAREAQHLPDAKDWTGAEIQSSCRLASLLDIPLIEAAKNVALLSWSSRCTNIVIESPGRTSCLKRTSFTRVNTGIPAVAAPEDAASNAPACAAHSHRMRPGTIGWPG
jgi:SpoVK/Ycf46/Vps4 family AAA+-type ATPase